MLLVLPLSLLVRQNISRLRDRHLVVMIGDEDLCRGGAAAPSPETEGSTWAFDLSHSEASSLLDDSAADTSSGKESDDVDHLSAEVGTRGLSVVTFIASYQYCTRSIRFDPVGQLLPSSSH